MKYHCHKQRSLNKNVVDLETNFKKKQEKALVWLLEQKITSLTESN